MEQQNKLKKIISVLTVIFIVTLLVSSGTYALWSWITLEDEKTNVVFDIDGENEMHAVLQGDTQEITNLLPVTSCTNETYAIKRKLTLTFDNESDNPGEVLLSLSIAQFTTPNGVPSEEDLSHLHYAVTTSPDHCTTDPIEGMSGTFTSISGDLFNDQKIVGPVKPGTPETTITFYLWVWIDEYYEYKNLGSSVVTSPMQDNIITLVWTGDINNDVPTLANEPVLDDGMIPVTIANDGTVKTINESSYHWYNYNNQEWANVVLVSSDSRTTYKDTTGVTVNQNDILAYYVWIPRYKYKIWDVTGTSSPQAIEILFEPKNEEPVLGTTVGSWRTHPAFIWDDNNNGLYDAGETLPGIWVGKFKSSVDKSSACYTTPNAENCNNTNQSSRILPNVSFVSYQSVSNQFTTSQNLNATDNIYGLTKKFDSHMMKSSEWGAVAYLSHSQYGINTEIRINNYHNGDFYLSGCGAATENEGSSTSCGIPYGGASSYPQSTTGNISGIFDMSGGLWQYVMGNYGNNLGSSGFSQMPSRKYYDLYTSTQFTGSSETNFTFCTLDTCGGHALSETYQWYSDEGYMVTADIPWILYGGRYDFAERSGIFTIGSYYGSAAWAFTWRSVLSEKLGSGEFKVKYASNGGTGTMSDTTCIYGNSCTLSTNTFTKTGYAFTGWNTSADGTGTDYSDGYTFSEFNYDSDITLYAQWSVHNVWIQFDTEGGIIASPTTLDGINYTWTADSNGIISRSVNGGDYDNKWFNISYGTERNLPNYDHAYYINISKTGYSAVSEAEWICLSGCSTNGATFDHLLDYSSDAFCDASNGDCTVVLGVNWSEKPYTITYYLGNATSTAGSTKLGTSTCIYGETCTLTTFDDLGGTFPYSDGSPSSETWTFYGWGTSSTDTSRDYENGEEFTYSSTGNLDLYAIGRKNYYFYMGKDPTSYTTSISQYWNPHSTSSSYLSSITLPTADSISSWSFYGYARGSDSASSSVSWNSSSEGTDVIPAYGDYPYVRTVYSRTLTVKYDGNGSTSGSTANTTAIQYYNTSIGSGGSVSTPSFTLAANGFVKAEHTFAGWNTNSAGTGSNYSAASTYTAWAPGVSDETVTKTLYAKWTENPTYTVTYVCNGGTGCPSNQTKKEGTALTLSSTKPTRDYYTFNNWSGSDGKTYSAGASYTTNAALTLTAQWTAVTTTINAERFTCEATDSISKLYLTSCSGKTCSYTKKNTLTSSFGSWTSTSIGDIKGTPSWSLNRENVALYSSISSYTSISSGDYTCKREVLTVNSSNGLNCRTGPSTSTSVVIALPNAYVRNVWRSTMLYNTSYRWWYNVTEDCYMVGQYLDTEADTTGTCSKITGTCYCSSSSALLGNFSTSCSSKSLKNSSACSSWCQNYASGSSMTSSSCAVSYYAC